MRVRVDLCAQCAETLRRVLKESGEKAMAEKIAPVVGGCPTCRKHLPPSPPGQKLVTVLKKPN